MSTTQTDYDSPWKEALERYFEPFMEFFFPEAHADIDWSRGYEFLDKELQQVTPDAELGKRVVDKLVKVWRKDGDETWLLVHIEVQSQPDAAFAERMYVYNYRLFDRYHCLVVSFAVLADDRPEWRPDQFGYQLWGCQVGIRFPVVKLLEYRGDWPSLEDSRNPFATVVMAHLKAQETRDSPEERLQWKLSLIKRLYEQGYGRKDILTLFRFIDWLMALPAELEREFEEVLVVYEEEKKMPYVTSVERIGIQRGILQDAREAAIDILETRFTHVPEPIVEAIHRIGDSSVLRYLRKKAVTISSLDEFERILSEGSVV